MKKLSRYFLLLIIPIFAFLVFTHLKTPIKCANSISCINNLTSTVENTAEGVFEGQKISPPKIYLTDSDLNPKVLGDNTTQGEKHIYVDLTTQTLTAYEGDTLFMKALVSTGKWFPTPTGDFKIWIKLRSTTMSGGSGADYYSLPNVPYVMFFAGSGVSEEAGFSLHGAYWHNNFGHPMSHGCVNMREVDAHKLYDWASPRTIGTTTTATPDDPGTVITITGIAPL